MSGVRSIAARITSAEHLRNSPDGNPRYRLTLDTGATVETARDAAVNYGITNYVDRGPVILTFDTRGHVVYAERGCPACQHVAHRGYCHAWEQSGGASGMRQRCSCSTSTPTEE